MYLLGICVFIFSSCQQEEEDLTKEFVPGNKLKKVLVDMYLVDGILMTGNFGHIYSRAESISTYQQIFNEHEITRADFDSAIDVLSKHPAEFDELYEQVLAELSRMVGEVKDTVDREERKNEKDQR